MTVYTTEITSEKLKSDNPIHQRLLKPYHLAMPYVKGNILEIGCGEGRGVALLAPKANKFYGIDKIHTVIDNLSRKYPEHNFSQSVVPPLKGLDNDYFDVVLSFQVIEHIKNDEEFLEEIYRVLKPGGVALITTPNIRKTLTRNPWHIREYTATQLKELTQKVFDDVELKGITGNDKIWEYYEQNKRSVLRFTRWDIFNLQYNLPSGILKIPYEILNRINRNKLATINNTLVHSISHKDYLLSDDPDSSLDLFGILRKK